MIRTYRLANQQCRVEEGSTAIASAEEAAWIDLCEPTKEEEKFIEGIIGAEIPTREEMAEIEVSSRVYMEREAAIMTVPLLIRSQTSLPTSTDVTFVLTPTHVVTIRYAEPTSFSNFAATLNRSPEVCGGAASTFAGLMDAVVDRIADVLEEVGRDLDTLSRAIFDENVKRRERDFRRQMQHLGRDGDIVSRARETLVGLARVAAFARDLDTVSRQKPVSHKLRLVARDVAVLSEHVGYLASKITFLLDATLGMINIEQSATIRMFSVIAGLFLPPTLIASIYGMNFEHMPELGWPIGYPLAIVAMLISMVVPWLYFKYRGWI